MSILNLVAITVYLLSIFIYSYFVKPLVKKPLLKSKWLRDVLPVFISGIIGTITFIIIHKITGTKVDFNTIIVFGFLTLLTSEVYKKSHLLWDFLSNKFNWIKPRKGANK